MSGPNDNYDPKQVAALSAEALEETVAHALAAFAAASSTAALKDARLAHSGEKSPIALANREIGALPPAARKDAGQRMGAARGRINAALADQTVAVPIYGHAESLNLATAAAICLYASASAQRATN